MSRPAGAAPGFHDCRRSAPRCAWLTKARPVYRRITSGNFLQQDGPNSSCYLRWQSDRPLALRLYGSGQPLHLDCSEHRQKARFSPPEGGSFCRWTGAVEQRGRSGEVRPEPRYDDAVELRRYICRMGRSDGFVWRSGDCSRLDCRGRSSGHGGPSWHRSGRCRVPKRRLNRAFSRVRVFRTGRNSDRRSSPPASRPDVPPRPIHRPRSRKIPHWRRSAPEWWSGQA